MQLQLQRGENDGIDQFGTLTIDGNDFTCDTLEAANALIGASTYTIEFTYSPEFSDKIDGNPMPLLDVDGREAIRIHWCNWVIDPDNGRVELKGCISVGVKDGSALDTSKSTFLKLYEIIKDQTDLTITILDA